MKTALSKTELRTKSPPKVETPVLTEQELNKLMDDSEVMSAEEARAKISMILAETKRPELMSELNPLEDKMLAVLKTISIKRNSEMLKVFINYFLLYRISYLRQGRKEILEVAKGIDNEEQKVKRGFRNMFGMRG